MTSPVSALLATRLRTDAAAPLITYYDDATGERIELSALTLANWVAKTANLLQDGLDVEPGQRVAVLLAPHWQGAAVLLGVWSVGAAVVETTPCDVLVLPEPRLPDYDAADAAHVLGLSLHPLGGGLRDPGPTVTDFAAEVPVYGDDFVPYSAPDPAAAAFEAGSLTLTHEGLAGAAGELARRMGLVAGDRLLVEVGAAAAAGPVAWLLAPLAAGASIVLSAHSGVDTLVRRAGVERVSVTLGCAVPGLRAAGAAGADPPGPDTDGG